MECDRLASEEEIEKTRESLINKGCEVYVVNNKQEAKELIIKLIPKGEEILNASSVTLDQIGITELIEKGDYYQAVKKRFISIENPVERTKSRRKNSYCNYVIGSVHALTMDGEFLVASRTGSQLAPYAYTANNVILVISTKKIVKNIEEGIERIYKCAFPRENERALKATGVPSEVNKILIIKKEAQKGRIKVILVKENLGF